MLVLSRRVNERILIDGDIRVSVLAIRGNQVRIGIEAPGSVKVIREELMVTAETLAWEDDESPEAEAPEAAMVGVAPLSRALLRSRPNPARLPEPSRG